MSDSTWRDEAACRAHNPDLWFPEEELTERGQPRKRETPRMYKEAKKICLACPVRVPCLEHALDQKECCGMWGAKTRPERATILRERRKAARKAAQ